MVKIILNNPFFPLIRSSSSSSSSLSHSLSSESVTSFLGLEDLSFLGLEDLSFLDLEGFCFCFCFCLDLSSVLVFIYLEGNSFEINLRYSFGSNCSSSDEYSDSSESVSGSFELRFNLVFSSNFFILRKLYPLLLLDVGVLESFPILM